jgi:class 3 adenylate cyclase/TolB-like protein/Tfp pilus assembly protein PilF
MSGESFSGKNFVNQAEAIILANVSNERFGVSELAEAMDTSHSNLLRKIKEHTRLPASQFIRQVRLEQGMEILSQTSLTVSEVSFKVGFGSTSDFIKAFREHYGYPPGEAGQRSDVDEGKEASTARQRQLVAIMFTDIKGYTSLMQTDEKKGIAFRERHREVFNSTTKKYKGRILQYYGDGTLSTFPSAIDAVHCGIEMQLAFKEEPRVPIRIGIHSGDTIVTNEEIIGDAVNVAARIESLAKPGSVYISDKVYDEVKNQQELLTASMGVHKLKNVAKPIEVYAVSNYALGKIEKPHTKVKGGPSLFRWSAVAAVAIIFGVVAYTAGLFDRISGSDTNSIPVDKSIAVLPFKNESSDSSNLYFVNGLMESTLNNLQKIKDLRVVSRSSVEKYRITDKTIPEIADELKVSYFVEGSGQKVGDRVLLNIQLIEASGDRHLWADQYDREIVDIFALQNEVAKVIANAIEAIVTPSELEQIEKKPTENLLAYDYFLQALDHFNSRTNEGFNKAIGLFEKAIEQDTEFALAYANIAISYYLLEMFQVEKQSTEKINSYADKALLYDSKSAESLIAKAVYYIQTKEYQLALPYLNKALEYNPNSSFAVQMLADFYFRMVPNTNKYLEYALKGIQLNAAANDSITQSYTYLQLSNALVSSGFMDEALKYINKSLDYDRNNYYAPHLKAMILFSRDGNAERTRNLLLKEWNKDTTRLDILQDIARMYYVQENYDSAYFYFKKFVSARKSYGLNMNMAENDKIAMVYKKIGLNAEAKKLFSDYSAYCEADQSPYRSVSLVTKYAYEGKIDQAIEQLRLFSETDNYPYWFLLMESDPLLKPLKNHPDFASIIQKIKDRFWENHASLKEYLAKEGLVENT